MTKKDLFKMTTTLMTIVAGIFGAFQVASWKSNRDAEYLENNLISVMTPQEKKFNTEYCQIPNLVHGLHEDFSSIPFASFYFGGAYDEFEKSIYITPRIFRSQGEFRQILNHELGHFYSHQVMEEFGIANQFDYVGNLGHKLISEGISEYFEKTLAGGKTRDKFEFPKNPQKLALPEQYKIGFYLVKPILDRDTKKGIECLLKNFPEEKDLGNLQDYQKRILKKLSHEGCK